MKKEEFREYNTGEELMVFSIGQGSFVGYSRAVYEKTVTIAGCAVIKETENGLTISELLPNLLEKLPVVEFNKEFIMFTSEANQAIIDAYNNWVNSFDE